MGHVERDGKLAEHLAALQQAVVAGPAAHEQVHNLVLLQVEGAADAVSAPGD